MYPPHALKWDNNKQYSNNNNNNNDSHFGRRLLQQKSIQFVVVVVFDNLHHYNHKLTDNRSFNSTAVGQCCEGQEKKTKLTVA